MPQGFHEQTRTLNAARDWLHRLGQDRMSPVAVAAGEGALRAAFAETQAAVHVYSGALKASGRIDSDMDGALWEGTIAYGGPGVEQAYWELYRDDRGGEHDYFRGLVAQEHLFAAALNKHFEWT